jgi:hypothetical protein
MPLTISGYTFNPFTEETGTLSQRLADAQAQRELRARVNSARCGYCRGLACGIKHQSQSDRTWSLR